MDPPLNDKKKTTFAFKLRKGEAWAAMGCAIKSVVI